ncbi:MAG: hypothetical protein M1591_09385 [Deltaproteobacteria bacterium]|nr:hypothetical protein [Deltaproteobacteria bacterium]
MKKLMLLAIVLAFTAGMTGCHKEATEQAAPAVTAPTTTTAAPASPTTAAPASPTTAAPAK